VDHGEAARADVQRLRARSSAILTGIGTVLADDPSLTVRDLDIERQPLRVVVDPHLRMQPAARMLALSARRWSSPARNMRTMWQRCALPVPKCSVCRWCLIASTSSCSLNI